MLEQGNLSREALRIIGGLIRLGPGFTGITNPIPLSYLRLIPGHEAPTSVVWGERNRNALIRIPLPNKTLDVGGNGEKAVRLVQTVELRSPDGAANIYHVLGCIASAVVWGFENAAEAERIARSHHAGRVQKTGQLPSSCGAAAASLQRSKKLLLESGILPEVLLDAYADDLKAYGEDRRWKTSGARNTDLPRACLPARQDKAGWTKLVREFFNCG